MEVFSLFFFLPDTPRCRTESMSYEYGLLSAKYYPWSIRILGTVLHSLHVILLFELHIYRFLFMVTATQLCCKAPPNNNRSSNKCGRVIVQQTQNNMSRNLNSQTASRVSRSSSGTSDKRPIRDRHHWALHWWSSDKESSPPSFDSPNTSTNTWCKSSKRVWVGRVLVVVVLVSTATALGYMTHRLLTNAEDNLAETQFESLTERALVEAEAISHRRRWSGVVMASVAGQLFPDAAQWPYVDFVGFETLVQALLDTSSGPDMGFAPLLTDPVNQGPLFEEHAYQVYRKLGFPEKAGNSSFGFGIWAQQGPNGTAKDKRYHDTTGETKYGSPYTIMTPLFRTDEGVHPVLLFNTNSGRCRARPQIDC